MVEGGAEHRVVRLRAGGQEGEAAARELPALRQHLAVCREYLEEYEALRDLARLETAGGLPGRDELLRELRRQRPEA